MHSHCPKGSIRRSMWQFVSGINAAGTTVILTTHYLEEAEQLCRNIAIIDRSLDLNRQKHGSAIHPDQASADRPSPPDRCRSPVP